MQQMIIKQYIICAAVLFIDGKEHEEQPENITNGFVIAGRRHNNCFSTCNILYGKDNVDSNVVSDKWIIVCGFITNDDKFVTRKEASEIAYNAKQINKKYEILISEHLY